ncbi:hypothetical protein F5Y00DRAFT_197162 [Daldinia vernicosa]|uniref:uncharacterized protein n=1 Tax=Daldinia vernicosa TaxID=114800 RepID=UPI002007D61B|nr:uncharacterized protein F5Y00DRAFT_197162 [Daldinia vernicosa]KAI0844524.1 hypothetical protein F5Y00DRAFT_197162 [Daldinia vernicosa]
MKTWAPAFSIAALLLPLVAADCEKFEFRGQYGGDGFTTTSNQSMPVSSWTNCTAELARGDGDNNNTCEFHHYSMGLVLHPEIRFINFDSETSEHIFELVRENANPTASSLTDFNATIVVNYTASHTDIDLGDVGYYAFTPFIRCFDGVLSDCDDDDDDPEDINAGKLIRACGLSWTDEDQSRLDPGHQQYSGREGFVQTSSPANFPDDPQPSYDSVSELATVHKDDGSVGSRASSATLLIALMCAAYNFI